MANGDMGFYLLWAWVAVMVFVGVGFDTARRMRLSFSNDNVRIYYYNPYHMGHMVWPIPKLKTQAKRKTQASTIG